MSDHERIIREMMARYKPVDVPGYTRKRHGIIVTHDEVRAVYFRFCKEKGVRPVRGGKVPRPVPDDFPQHAHEDNLTLTQRYGVNREVIFRWRNETGLKLSTAPRTRSVKQAAPDDLCYQARLMTRRQLAEHYGKSFVTIDGWLRSIGCRAKQDIIGRPAWSHRSGITKPHDARENSRAGQAANFMARYWSTFRADARGYPLPDGFFWNCGGKVMTDDEIIAVADEKRERDARLLNARMA